MPLISNTNHNTAILNDIISWLSQTKVAGTANYRVPIGEVAVIGGDGFDLANITYDQTATLTLDELAALTNSELDCTVSFYTDAGKTTLAFTDNTANASAWTVTGTRLYYAPPDSLINAASGLSSTLNQPLYYVTATYTDGTTVNLTYKNAANLMFQSVIVANTKNPSFSKNESQAIIVPSGEKTERMKLAGDYNYLICAFDVYFQLAVFNWGDLSEQERVVAGQNVANAIRNTLYIDRTRNGHCTFHDKDLRGTSVGDMKPIKSDAMLKGMVQVRTASLVNSSGF